MIKTLCAKFRKQNHPNNTLLLTWAAFLSHFRPAILHDLLSYQQSVGVACGSHSESLAFVAAGEATPASGIRLRRRSRQGAAPLQHRGGC